MKKENCERLSIREKVCYGLGDLSGNIMFSAVSFYLLYFFVNVGGLTPALAGVVFFVARLWDAITDYFMGRISDNTKSKWGKRRVYMLFGAIPYGLMFILLWLVPFGENTAQAVRFLYYTVAYMLYNTTWTIVYIPYSALTANMTRDYDERTSLNGYRIVLANVGILLGAALFALFADGTESLFFGLFQSETKAYAWAGTVFGILAIVIMLISAINVRERYDDGEKNDSGFFRTLKEFFSLKEFRNTILYYLMSMAAFDIIMAVFIFFVNDTLGFGGGGDAMLFVAIPLVTAICTAPIWVKLSEKFDKAKVYTFAAILISVCLLYCLLCPAQNYVALIALTVFVGVGMSAIQILPYASVPDVIEIDEYVNGKRREGAYYGIVQFMYKLASGFAVGVVSLILEFFGYVENAPVGYVQPEAALVAIRFALGVLPGIIFLLSIIFARRAHIDRTRYNDICKELEKRRAEQKSES